MKKVFVSPYSLTKKKLLNAKDQNLFQLGALLKISDDKNWGVSDICPKPELGDLDLESEIKNKGILYQRALELANEDLEARKRQISLLFNKRIKNNFLITNYKTEDLNNSLYSKSTIKIKADRDLESLSQLLNEVVTDVRIRIDFNSILSSTEYEDFLNRVTPEVQKKIDYVEDPTAYQSLWSSWNKRIPLAFDFQKVEYENDFALYCIVKPSRQSLNKQLKNYTLTSAMEHPVGLAHGLRIAQQLAQNDSGFLTLDLFEENKFNNYFEQIKNYLNFSSLAREDSGIGMTEELNKLKWIEL